MDDDQFDKLIGTLQKMGDLQIAILTKVTRLQAQLLTHDGIIKAVLLNQGANADELLAQNRAAFREFDELLLGTLKTWLAEKQIAFPKDDDPWWDKPPA